MQRKYYYVEIFALLILYHISWNHPSTKVIDCPRNKSRLVRLIIQKKMLPLLLRYKLTLPLSCPFHSDRDVLWWPDIQSHFEGEHWICPFCGNIFPSEDEIIGHWDTKHAQEFYQNEDSICLANFCDILRCEVILAALESEKAFSSNTLPSIHHHHHGNSSQCDHRKMFLLQRKCKIVMRQCLLGLLSTISTKDFQDIEDMVNIAICSYLTCNKYLDGSLQVVQPVPVLICIIVGVILLAGFCLCYYVVWRLTDPLYTFSAEVYCNGAMVSNPFGLNYGKPNQCYTNKFSRVIK